MKHILVTGACGQIGSELTLALRERYGGENVVATGHRTQPSPALRDSGPFEFIDVTQRETVEAVVERYNIDTIYHMAAILSATGEQNPHLAWDVNINGLYNILEIAREREMVRVFCPSSIAVFGPETPRDSTPQETVLRPTTMYGVTKVAGELLCNYYFQRFGLDVRGVRYPGIISSETLPGGGTTDYAVEIFYEALKHKRYTCFLRRDTVLPMMYMPDCIKATIDLMEADLSRLRHHADFNLAAISFCPEELVTEIQKHVPVFVCEYEPD
ncbi:MAG TPA: NAD-dependent epimerase/dehydratase family protein, partial [Anaerolineae bacterium]|nr:NAD-dependent epimerase/dehydratase family protein [Anaerolineae bacterium]